MTLHDESFEVVGVVRDVPPVHPGEETGPQIFWSNRQVPRPATYFVVRVSGDPVAAGRAVRDRLRAFDASLQVTAVRSMRDWLSAELVRPRFSAALLGTFGALALLLAALGTYGLVSYTVARQRKAIGVRMALGARPAMIVGDVLRRGLRLAGFAAVIGVGIATVTSRLLASQLAGVTPMDPVSFAASFAVLMAAAALACVIPAWRASRVDPMEALRVD